MRPIQQSSGIVCLWLKTGYQLCLCVAADSNAMNETGGAKPACELKGWLYKWTNYLKGYQKRWFVLANGSLAYFRNKGEVGHTCRGSINLQGAFIHTEDSCNFVISNGTTTQTFHLRASSEVERQQWVTALELARVRAIRAAELEELKLENALVYQRLAGKHGHSLQKALQEIELGHTAEYAGKIRTIQERATLFRITTNAMINVSLLCLLLLTTQSRKWLRLLQHEHKQRLTLEEQLEQLARQHSALERAAMKEVLEHSHGNPKFESATSDDDGEVFHDAAEAIADVYNVYPIFSGLATARFVAAGLQKGRTFQGPSEYVPPTRPVTARKRRSTIPPRPNVSLSLWSIMKNCIGKELSKIPMPVNFNEPLSMLQRLTEDLEYSQVVDRAAQCGDVCEQMCYVAAFTVSSYATTVTRTGKPFNPLLGETYECDRTDDMGWRSVSEQVSHHPPAAALYAESERWKLSKFRGKYLSIIPMGYSHLEFTESGNYYVWRKVTTVVHNIIVGKLWIDNYGEMTIEEKKHGIKCHLKYIPYSYFSKDTPRRVTGVVTDKEGTVHWMLKGTWDDYIECAKVVGQTSKQNSDKHVFETLTAGSESFYNLTLFAVQLNEPEKGVAPTDSRNRPDQRLMEEGKFDEANEEKVRLEEKQRAERKRQEQEAEQSMVEGKPYKGYQPLWFVKQKDPWTGGVIHKFNNRYWDNKARQDWSLCPDIY
ncbi:oxysterol binding protein [Trichuris trichiura]|uniref:Oxysterol-binding protein n=1 Tax=Trichuris trichiura TaxID=36087 RepID=A0A077ZAY8_TRITR|nr:oxysterol binding protein [Trichuris trichiura]